MAQTFYFYDLETTGFNARSGRIMQFGGQRTNLDLKPIGQPDDFLIKLTEDVLPDPGAIMMTGITPQQTIAKGITEAEFAKYFQSKIATPDTIFVGYNTVRFDDEFIRHLMYRNFYDPYEWQWQLGRSRWDLLDVTRMTRALRPDGIKWPFDSSGKPSNQLGLLASINKLEHANAHDAISDVNATIDMAKLLLKKQSKLFKYLLKMRSKTEIASLVNAGQPFVYTSGKYASEYSKTTVVTKLADHPKRQGILVYDLRHDPRQFAKLTVNQLVEAWQWHKPDEGITLPIKTLQFNRVPAVAPLNVLANDPATLKRLKLNMLSIENNLSYLLKIEDWPAKLFKALEIMDKKQQARFLVDAHDVDFQLYDDFYDNSDKSVMQAVRSAEPAELSGLEAKLKDKRLRAMLPLYKARNYPSYLTAEERQTWDEYRLRKLTLGDDNSQLAKYYKAIEEAKTWPGITKEQQLILNELKLYGDKLLPDPLT